MRVRAHLAPLSSVVPRVCICIGCLPALAFLSLSFIMLRFAFLLCVAAAATARADLPPSIKSAISGHWSCVLSAALACAVLVHVLLAGAITSSSEAAFELHVVPPSESDATLSRVIDSFAQASDADLAVGQQALQAQLRNVLAASGKSVQMLVGSSLANVVVRAYSGRGACSFSFPTCVAGFLQDKL